MGKEKIAKIRKFLQMLFLFLFPITFSLYTPTVWNGSRPKSVVYKEESQQLDWSFDTSVVNNAIQHIDQIAANFEDLTTQKLNPTTSIALTTESMVANETYSDTAGS